MVRPMRRSLILVLAAAVFGAVGRRPPLSDDSAMVGVGCNRWAGMLGIPGLDHRITYDSKF